MTRSRAHVEHIWDTAVSLRLDAPDGVELPAAVEEITRWLHRVDATLSSFRPDSDLCRWQRGLLRLSEADSMLAEVLTLATEAELLTDGGFTLNWSPAGPDPTGLVKGWAVDRAVEIALQNGVTDLQINAGGDLSAVGSRPTGGPWRIGIEHPADASLLLDVVTGHRLCLATSGTSQRGSHIRLKEPAVQPVSAVTVMGPSCGLADGISTGALALGVDCFEMLARLDPTWQSLVLLDDGRVWTSPGWVSAQRS